MTSFTSQQQHFFHRNCLSERLLHTVRRTQKLPFFGPYVKETQQVRRNMERMKGHPTTHAHNHHNDQNKNIQYHYLQSAVQYNIPAVDKMSLFRVCNWWSAQCPDLSENYDSHTFLACRLGLQENEKDYMVVGSHIGLVSIFYPVSEPTEDGNFSGFSPNDLMLETKLNSPILGIVAGKFGSSSKKGDDCTQLAVLHPLSVAIYSLSHSPGMTECGTQSTLHLNVEHRLPKSNYTICKGPFGGVKGREFLCVTHIDGSLTFFEQDGISYSRNLAGEFSIPSPTVYDAKSDAFIRVNSVWEVESFSYKDLSEAGSDTMVTPTWSICIGEFPLQIIPVRITNTRTQIMILGECNLISISDEGKVVFIKKLDYTPVCFHSFIIGWYWEPNARLLTTIVSDSGQLFIYENATLIWAAQLEATPIAILRSNLSSLAGALCMLHPNGLIQIGFLGSEPYVFQVPTINAEDIDFDRAHEELVSLENEIKRSIDVADMNVINAQASQDIDVDIQVSNTHQEDENGGIRTGSLLTTFKANINLDQLQFTFNTAEDVVCSEPVVTYNDIAIGASGRIESNFRVSDKVYIHSTRVEIIISFINKHSIPRVITKSCLLPSTLFYRVIPVRSHSANKVNVSLSLSEKLSAPKFAELFGKADDGEDSDSEATNSIALQCIQNESVVTILTAKNSNRFRIQSNTVEAIASVLEIIIQHCENLNLSNDKRDAKKSKRKVISCSPNIPVDEVMRRVLYHYEIQQDIKEKTAYMDALWNQFKLFQRCLQSKNEGDEVDGIVMLIDTTYDELIAEGDLLVQLREDKRRAANNLSCAIALVRHITNNCNADEKILEKILPIFAYPIEDWSKQSWEELSAPSLRRLKEKGFKANEKSSNPDTNVAFEYARFKENMTHVLDSICRLPPNPQRGKLRLGGSVEGNIVPPEACEQMVAKTYTPSDEILSSNIVETSENEDSTSSRTYEKSVDNSVAEATISDQGK